uniref:F-box domain-containing protein n=1 Tax=Caenorhabditis tropicalis TaxID=1561998 RepID=A0A1I7TL23_9PELO
MAFPLLKLPSLAYEEVLSNFNVPDIIDFSLLSSRCHRIIRSTRFPLTGIGISVSFFSSDCLLFYNGGPRPFAVWRFMKKRWRKVSDTINGWRRIGRTRIRIQKEPEWVSKLKPDTNMKVAFEYVRDLFRLPITQFDLLSTDQNVFPQQYGITKCDELLICVRHEIPVDELKYVLEKMEISKTFSLSLQKNDNFEFDFVRFSMDVLKISRAFWITKETFLAMDCARITLQGNKKLPIKEFVSQWLSSRNTRFEWLKMHENRYWNDEEINWNDGLEPMKWNPAIRGRNFKISHFQRVDCEKGIDFLRDDGLLATVVKGNFNKIYFIVWHKRFQPEADSLDLDFW